MYSEHFRTADYELNPLWQEAVAKLRWFDARHFAATLTVATVVIWLGEVALVRDPLIAFLIAFVFGALGMINGRHLGNLATFAYLRRHPEQLTGTVTLGHEFVLFLSLFQLGAVLVPMTLLMLPSPTPRSVGAFAGVVGIALANLAWIRRHRAKKR